MKKLETAANQPLKDYLISQKEKLPGVKFRKQHLVYR